jgi:hypothetical protein
MGKNAIKIAMKAVIHQKKIAEEKMVIAKNVIILIMEKNAKINQK